MNVMISHATEEQVTSAVTSRTIGELKEAVLSRGPAPGGQYLCNWTRDTMPSTSTEERCFLFGPLRGYITRPTEMRSVSGLEWSWVESSAVGRQLQPARTWNSEHGIWGIYGVGSRHQTTGEHTADCEGLVRAVVNCRVRKLATALQLLVVTICKCSINPITNPNSSTIIHVKIYWTVTINKQLHYHSSIYFKKNQGEVQALESTTHTQSWKASVITSTASLPNKLNNIKNTKTKEKIRSKYQTERRQDWYQTTSDSQRRNQVNYLTGHKRKPWISVSLR
jgi:hypothetical protein